MTKKIVWARDAWARPSSTLWEMLPPRSAHFAPIAEKRNYWDRLAPAPVARKFIFRNSHSKFTCLRPGRSLLTVACDNEIVLHRKYIGNPVGTKVRKVFIGFVIHHTFQRDVATLHDDMDGWHRLNRVAREGGIPIDGAIDGRAGLVIHRRGRRHLGRVRHRRHSLNALYGGLGIGLQAWPGHLAV